MNKSIRNEEIIEEAKWFLENRSSIREVARDFFYSPMTVYRDLTMKLKVLDPELYNQVQELLKYNKDHRIEKARRGNSRFNKSKGETI